MEEKARQDIIDVWSKESNHLLDLYQKARGRVFAQRVEQLSAMRGAKKHISRRTELPGMIERLKSALIMLRGLGMWDRVERVVELIDHNNGLLIERKCTKRSDGKRQPLRPRRNVWSRTWYDACLAYSKCCN